MKLDDSCSCGAEFKAKGLPVNVSGAYEAWLAVHASCRRLRPAPKRIVGRSAVTGEHPAAPRSNE